MCLFNNQHRMFRNGRHILAPAHALWNTDSIKPRPRSDGCTSNFRLTRQRSSAGVNRGPASQGGSIRARSEHNLQHQHFEKAEAHINVYSYIQLSFICSDLYLPGDHYIYMIEFHSACLTRHPRRAAPINGVFVATNQ